MDDLKARLDEVRERARPAPGAFDRLVTRRERRVRRRRVEAIVLAFALGAASTVAVFAAFRADDPPRPARPDGIVLPLRTRRIDPGTYAVALTGTIRLEVARGWRAEVLPGAVTLSRALAGGGRVDVLIWDPTLLRPIDPVTGDLGPTGAGDRWYGRFAGRAEALGNVPEIDGVSRQSNWRWRQPAIYSWLLAFDGTDAPRATDTGIDGRWGYGLRFEHAGTEEVFASPGGRVSIADGSYFVWWSDLPPPLPFALGYAAVEGADPDEASVAAWEVLRSIDLPRRVP